MTNNNVISTEEWIAAEKELYRIGIEPQPKGSITVEQFARMTNRSESRARAVLSEMCKKGLATSRKWRNGSKGGMNAYFLKKK